MEWYEHRRATQLREFEKLNPALAGLLRDLDAVYLFGTIGFESVMRSDGTVLVAVDEHWSEPDAPEPPWRTATDRERSLAIVAASERWPELSQLLPRRPANAPDCSWCQGRGVVAVSEKSIFCSECGALGWLNGPAT